MRNKEGSKIILIWDLLGNGAINEMGNTGKGANLGQRGQKKVINLINFHNHPERELLSL